MITLLPGPVTGLLAVSLLSLAPLTSAQDDPASQPSTPGDATPEQPGVWNQWRGPERSGADTGTAWPAELSAENFTEQWRIPAGPSYSGPVVDAMRVYTTATVDKEEEVVWAIDRATGEKVWETRWKGSMTVPFFAARNGSWIRSTPTLADGMLYVAGMLDVLVCLDAETGREIWRVDFKERYKTPKPDFGCVCSPLVVGDHLYFQAGASLVKLDRKTGETVWRSMSGSGGMMESAFSSPVLATVAGTEQLLVQTRESLAGVQPENGSVLWSRPIKTFRGMNILTPQPYGESGVFTSAYGGRAHLFDVASGEEGFTVEETWTNRAQGYMTSPVMVGDHAYLYLRSQRFSCVDMKSGEVAWISEPMGDEYWSLAAQGERVLALSNNGELFLIQHNPKELEITGRVSVSEGETWAHLAVDGDQVFVRELDGLKAFRWR